METAKIKELKKLRAMVDKLVSGDEYETIVDDVLYGIKDIEPISVETWIRLGIDFGQVFLMRKFQSCYPKWQAEPPKSKK